jgi:excisionase family DNA binding protein
MAKPQDFWRTTKDVAFAANVCPETVRRYADEGLVPFTRTSGKHRRFSDDAISIIAERVHGRRSTRKP